MRSDVPCRDPPSCGVFAQLGPVAVVQSGDGLPGQMLIQPDQGRNNSATGDSVRGYDGAVPRCQVSEELVGRRTGTLGDLSQALTVASALDVVARCERRLRLGEALSHVAGGHPLPLAGVDLAQPLVVPHLKTYARGERTSGVSRTLKVTADDHRGAVRRERECRRLRLLPARVGQRGVELALPDAAAVVVGVAMAPDDQGPRALLGHHV